MSKFNFKKLYGWLLVSNRWKHFGMGTLATILGLLFMYLCNVIGIPQSISNGLVCLIFVFGMMCSVEFIQKKGGGIWDWLDIFAGILFPLTIVNILILVYG